MSCPPFGEHPPALSQRGNVQTHVVSGRTIQLGVERDSYGYLRVKPANAAGKPIRECWSPTAKTYVPNHPV